MIADLLTKAVSKVVHETLVGKLFGWDSAYRSTDRREQGGRKREAHKRMNRCILDVVSLMDKEGRQLKAIGLEESSYKKGKDWSVNTGVLTIVLTTISIRKFGLLPYKGIFLIRKV